MTGAPLPDANPGPAPVEAGARSTPPAAAGSSFYAALRILPKDQREAMYEVYAFCRAVDDIADDGGPRTFRRNELRQWRNDIDAFYEGRGIPSRLAPLAPAIRRYRLQRADFLAIIDGMDMDASTDIRAPDWATLDLYCDRVASAVGRLSVRIFGVPEDEGVLLAHHLGRALQLTNILRDVDEDAGIGRLYLPREALEASGIRSSDPATVLAHPRLATVCNEIGARARSHFREAEDVTGRCPRSTTRSPRLMAAVYRQILDRTLARGWAAPRSRVRLPKHRLVFAALRHGLF